MSQSKSLKADKELMWKKLSTVTKPEEFVFHDVGRRGGVRPGEMMVFASGRWQGVLVVGNNIVNSAAST